MSWIHNKERAMRTHVYILSSIYLCILAFHLNNHHHYLTVRKQLFLEIGKMQVMYKIDIK